MVRKKIDPVFRTVSEEQFQKNVIREAQLYGWKIAHFRKAQSKRGNWITPVAGDGKGFVDLVLALEDDRVIFAELKRQDGYLKPEQKMWRDLLISAGQEWYLWKPSMMEEITDILQKRGCKNRQLNVDCDPIHE